MSDAKKIANRLDQHAESLRAWDAEKKTIAWILQALKDDGCVSSRSSVGEYLERLRSEDQQKAMLGLIADGASMNKKLDVAFAENPDPAVERLIQNQKSLIMQAQIAGATDPDMLKLANAMLQTTLNYLSGKTRAELEFRKIELAESKFRDHVSERKRVLESELASAKISGGITPETLEKIERELKLL